MQAIGPVQDLVMNVIDGVLNAVGLVGVSAGAVVTIAMLLIWGYRLQRLADIGQKILGSVVRHAVVSAVVLVGVFAAALHLGIIPGVNIDAAIQVAQEAVRHVQGLVGGAA
ncbi:hypothetical protein G3I44_04185 [Halogeometricum borinquense]|uniref:Uncharacterized protein n=1 Tax=Halogeometricum borinquense TaxID=60847 RepID=A0A6C0UDU4_9EURY|nr:hypothetical protein [Halogeometricum borinquense]QIB73552.1 hypothetical protein G3I44_04185 [Halogeometricum borinquense]